MTGTRDLLLDVLTEGRQLPPGYQRWAFRAVHRDGRSSRGFRWPQPGEVAVAPGPILAHTDICPHATGDGLCAAFTPAGMASGGIPARTILLVALRDQDVLGGTLHQARVREALVVDRLRLADFSLAGANLRDADLSGVDLSAADLTGADLTCADLCGADLHGADLRGADMSDADIAAADLTGANLTGADLRDADMRDANLRDANLTGAILSKAIMPGSGR